MLFYLSIKQHYNLIVSMLVLHQCCIDEVLEITAKFESLILSINTSINSIKVQPYLVNYQITGSPPKSHIH